MLQIANEGPVYQKVIVMKFSELQNQPAAELKRMAGELKAELRGFRFGLGNRQLKHTHKVQVARKTLARIATLLTKGVK